MTEKSYFHDGVANGDAIYAPYNAQLYTSILRNLYGRDPLVIPYTEYNELEVIGTAGRTVIVRAGYAYVQGVLYVNEADDSLTIVTNTSPYPRIDRIVVRIDWTNHTTELGVIQGIAAPLPTLPPVKQLDDIYEMPLAWVYLEAGYTTTANKVIDERHFAATALYQQTYTPHNNVGNSAFMGFSGERLAGTAIHPPDMWDLFDGGSVTPDSIESVENTELAFGRGIKITTDAYGGIEQTTLKPDQDTLITTRVLIKVETGSVYVGSYGLGSTVYPTQDVVEVLLRDYRGTGKTNRISIFALSDSTVFTLYQVTSTYGHIEVRTPEDHEIILFDYTVLNTTGYTMGTTYSTSTVTVTTENWPNTPDVKALLTGARAAIVKLGVTDSGSAGKNDCGVAIRDPINNGVILRVVCGGMTNSAYVEAVGIIPLEDSTPNSDAAFEFELDIVASGANTLRIELEIQGVIV